MQSGVSLGLLALAFVGCAPPSPDAANTDDQEVTSLDSAAHFNAWILESPEDASRYVDRAAWHLRQGRITLGWKTSTSRSKPTPTTPLRGAPRPMRCT